MNDTRRPLGPKKLPAKAGASEPAVEINPNARVDFFGDVRPSSRLLDAMARSGQLLPQRAIDEMNDSLKMVAALSGAGATMIANVKLEASVLRPEKFKNQMYFFYCPRDQDPVAGFERTIELMEGYKKVHPEVRIQASGPKYVIEADNFKDLLTILNDGLLGPIEQDMRDAGKLPENETLRLDLDELLKPDSKWVDRAKGSSDQGHGGHGK